MNNYQREREQYINPIKYIRDSSKKKHRIRRIYGSNLNISDEDFIKNLEDIYKMKGYSFQKEKNGEGFLLTVLNIKEVFNLTKYISLVKRNKYYKTSIIFKEKSLNVSTDYIEEKKYEKTHVREVTKSLKLLNVNNKLEEKNKTLYEKIGSFILKCLFYIHDNFIPDFLKEKVHYDIGLFTDNKSMGVYLKFKGYVSFFEYEKLENIIDEAIKAHMYEFNENFESREVFVDPLDRDIILRFSIIRYNPNKKINMKRRT